MAKEKVALKILIKGNSWLKIVRKYILFIIAILNSPFDNAKTKNKNFKDRYSAIKPEM